MFKTSSLLSYISIIRLKIKVTVYLIYQEATIIETIMSKIIIQPTAHTYTIINYAKNLHIIYVISDTIMIVDIENCLLPTHMKKRITQGVFSLIINIFHISR